MIFNTLIENTNFTYTPILSYYIMIFVKGSSNYSIGIFHTMIVQTFGLLEIIFYWKNRDTGM